MISKYYNFRHKSGFTLGETLIAVGILAVLLAIAIPGVISARSQLKMAELDASAKHIFIAAQNRITGMKTSGQLESLDSGTQLEYKPEDYPEELQDWEDAGSSYFYVNQDQGEKLLPTGSIDQTVHNGYYVIEYNRFTAMIYGVFYGEVPFEQEYNSGSIDRSKNNRSSIPLGYYGGNNIDSSEVGICPTPEFEIVNEEELYIKLSRLTWEDPGKLIFTVEISHPDDDSTKKTYAFRNSDGVAVANSNPVTYVDGYYKILLDSLADGYHFHQLFKDDENNNWVPGKDLLVSITVTDTDNKLMPATNEKKANSLFQSLSNGTANVAFGRHLQNLEASVSHLDGTVTLNRGSQTEDIHWSSSENFVPINNPSLGKYNGNRFTITDIMITKPNNGYAGLFGDFTGSELKNIYLCNPHITVVTASATGTLAGRAENSDISGCQVYINKEENETNKEYSDFALTAESGYVGGLLGTSINCKLVDSSASMPEITTINGTAGGLIGYVNGGTVKTCYSDTGYRTGDDSFMGGITAVSSGGLAGLADNSAFFDTSYALSKLSSHSDSAGLLAGFFNAAEDSVKADNCYSVILEGGVTNGFANRGIFNNCFYFSNAMANNAPPANILQKTYAEMVTCFSGGRWCKSSAETTHPYGCTGEYPFPALSSLPHYGDWPEDNPIIPDVRVLGLVYYEKYADGSLGLFGFDEDGNVGNSLRNDEEIYDTGYGMFVPKDDLKKYYKFEIPGVHIPENEPDPLKETLHLLEELPFFDIKISVGEDSLYPFNDYMIEKLSFGTDYNTTGIVQITESTDNSINSENAKKHEFKINVRFGAAIEPPNRPGTMGTETMPLQLRTQEHYTNIAIAKHFAVFYYKQTRNIIMSEDWESLNIGMKNAVIDGGSIEGYKIYNLKQPLINSDGNNENTLQNIYIEGANITSLSGKESYGILINESHGRIKNCTISNSLIDAGNKNAAGLAGIAMNSMSILENNLIWHCIITSNNNAAGLTINGNGAAIRSNRLEENCTITSSQKAAGLVLYGGGAAIEDNHLENCKINSSAETASGLIYESGYNSKIIGNRLSGCSIDGNKNTAGLANIVKGGSIISNWLVNNCKVTSTAEAAAGLLIDGSDSNIENNHLRNCEINSYAGAASGLLDHSDYSSQIVNNTLADCTVQALNSSAAGFIGKILESANSSIKQNYTNCTVIGYRAAGFAIEANSKIKDCYALGSVTGTEEAAGFVLSYPDYRTDLFSYCYTASEVTTRIINKAKYAFAPKKSLAFSQCYYLAKPDSTYGESVGAHIEYTDLTFDKLTVQGWGDSWETATLENSFPTSDLETAYPFPKLKGLDHYGDWPLPPS